ncbi:unnamed protein product, partial [Ixodes persulcatus]
STRDKCQHKLVSYPGATNAVVPYRLVLGGRSKLCLTTHPPRRPNTRNPTFDLQLEKREREHQSEIPHPRRAGGADGPQTRAQSPQTLHYLPKRRNTAARILASTPEHSLKHGRSSCEGRRSSRRGRGGGGDYAALARSGRCLVALRSVCIFPESTRVRVS